MCITPIRVAVVVSFVIGLVAISLRQARAATTQLAAGSADSEFAFEVSAARSFLATALLYRGQQAEGRQLLLEDFDEATANMVLDDALFTVTGKLPTFAADLEPRLEASRRYPLIIAMARKGDFEGALQQVTRIPVYANQAVLQARGYREIAKRQLERNDKAGARATAGRMWKVLQTIPKDGGDTKLFLLLDLTEIAAQLQDQQPARKLASIADQHLTEFAIHGNDEADALLDAMSKLARCHAEVGDMARARKLLDDVERRIRSLAANAPDAGDRCELETNRGRISNIAGNRADALQSFAHALEWAQRDHERSENEGDGPLDSSGFIAGLASLGIGVQFVDVCLGQVAAGDQNAAMRSWEKMPLCPQKPLTLLKMAEYAMSQEHPTTAQRCAARCRKMRNEIKKPPSDVATLAVVHIAILKSMGKAAEAGQAIQELPNDARLRDSPEAKKVVANELIAQREEYSHAYQVVMSIEPPHHAVALSKLAMEVAKAAASDR